MKSGCSNVSRSLQILAFKVNTHIRIQQKAKKKIRESLTIPIENQGCCLGLNSVTLFSFSYSSSPFGFPLLSFFPHYHSFLLAFHLPILLPFLDLFPISLFLKVYLLPCSVKHWSSYGHCKWVYK